MTTTVSITPCWKSAWRRGLDRARLLAAAVLCLLAVLAGPARATEISGLRVERTPEGLMVAAQVHFDLPQGVDEALQKGIPLFFVTDAVLLRDRWYWYDKEVSAASRYMRLSYHPLTRRWRLLAASSPIGNAGLSLGQNFETRDEALAAVQRISGWKIADAGDLEPDQRYSVSLRFRLDVSQLPRPFQIGVVGQADWNIATSRSLRLPAEIAR
ncbi:DUF4390 domain-containing protein [Ramlibacter sp. MAHUQ-53]|uniref:DUF4390 domain-containing protein n=1 Tax=unclassified Ramlibacter TaxID=2617605 RepID=UPI00363909BF